MGSDANYPPGAIIPPTPSPLPPLPPSAAGAVAFSAANGGSWQQWNGTTWASVLGLRGQALYNGLSGGHPVPLVASGTAAGTIKSTQATVSSGFTQPDVPRSVDIAFPGSWDGGNVTVHGTDANNAVITALYTANPGNTVTGTIVFKTITSLTNSHVGVDTADATVSVSSVVSLTYFLPTGAFAPQSLAFVLLFWYDGNANTSGWVLLEPDATAKSIDLSVANGAPAGYAPNGHTIYFLITGN